MTSIDPGNRVISAFSYEQEAKPDCSFLAIIVLREDFNLDKKITFTILKVNYTTIFNKVV